MTPKREHDEFELDLFAEELSVEELADASLQANCLASIACGGSFACAGSCGSSISTSSTFSTASG